ncbi:MULTISPECIES: hypothetical protein [unclassified Polaromonas]|uniref:hypothetical protein n=1 Tax=unclassified Polaromonas TaxID=2638319 RepID=UPI000F09191A|nr:MULTISPECIES: hypothetical protein [unclassified Polaromonas]AYQ27633.1 hypothetical protein DT070_06055 [Polaromonas sp. SP1]QGJ17523.1 hypothetical protein F7R28_03380 [Polaromonas sp. Pch-P]
MNDILNTAAKVQDAADKFTTIADEMKTKRRKAFDEGKITADEVMQNVSEETMLRELATKLYVKSNDYVVAGAQASQMELNKAIADAKEKIAEIAQFKRAVNIFVSVIGLAGSILSGQPLAIVGAISGVKEAVKGGEEKDVPVQKKAGK